MSEDAPRNGQPAGYLSLAEAASRIGRSVNTLWLWARAKRIEMVKIQGKTYVHEKEVTRVPTPEPWTPRPKPTPEKKASKRR